METIYVMDRNYNINKFDKNIKYNKHNKNSKVKSSKFNINSEINQLYKFSLKYSGGWKLAFKKWFKLSDKEPYSILIDNLPEYYKMEFDYEINKNNYNIKLKFDEINIDKLYIKKYAMVLLCMPDINYINKVNMCVNEDNNYINIKLC